MPESSELPQGPVKRARAKAARVRISGRKARKAIFNPAGLKGVFVEAAWLTTHIAMYPMGLVEERAVKRYCVTTSRGSRQSSAA